jgi:signal transduction histidine kinase
MTERARMLGGVYEIDSTPENGTTIKIKLAISPVNERN